MERKKKGVEMNDIPLTVISLKQTEVGVPLVSNHLQSQSSISNLPLINHRAGWAACEQVRTLPHVKQRMGMIILLVCLFESRS
jgi:hypothetical protein